MMSVKNWKILTFSAKNKIQLKFFEMGFFVQNKKNQCNCAEMKWIAWFLKYAKNIKWVSLWFPNKKMVRKKTGSQLCEQSVISRMVLIEMKRNWERKRIRSED